MHTVITYGSHTPRGIYAAHYRNGKTGRKNQRKKKKCGAIMKREKRGAKTKRGRETISGDDSDRVSEKIYIYPGTTQNITTCDTPRTNKRATFYDRDINPFGAPTPSLYYFQVIFVPKKVSSGEGVKYTVYLVQYRCLYCVQYRFLNDGAPGLTRNRRKFASNVLQK